jgi:hypothetical protein
MRPPARLPRIALLAALAGGAGGLPAAPAAARPADPHGGATLLLRVRAGEHVRLYARPGGRTVARYAARTEFGSRTVFAVLARRGAWAQVSATQLGGRRAWLRMDRRVAPRRTQWQLDADLSDRTLTVVRDGVAVRTLRVGVGARSSPTPRGRFQVTDKLPGARYGASYGCCILALSTDQPRPPPGWQGMARMAVHGTNAPGTVGRAASAGCLHARAAALRWLMRTVPVGTPVVIAG